MANTVLRIGTRSSGLAMIQATWIAERLKQSGVESALVPISTRGDQQQDRPIEGIGTGGVFTKELQKALLDGRIDVAVHSLKDLPTDPIKGLALAALPARESPFDVLVSREGQSLGQLPRGARIGTGSLRRRTQLWHNRSDLQMVDARGNVDTRIRKLHEGQFDALVLAEAGLKRLGFAAQATEVLAPPLMLPAVGQGALAVEGRAHDEVVRKAVAILDDESSRYAVTAERTLLATLRGGCFAPVGAWGRVEDDGRLRLTACVLSYNGSRRLGAEALGNAAEAVTIGRQVAERLLDDGAAALISEARMRTSVDDSTHE